jgi:BirA family biotin operon repressor/biotin-[acetyl-CoA-carboxylase] ligase
LRAAVLRPDGLWREISVTAQTGSTNADLLARAAAGPAEGTVLAAEEQTAGRGRLGRQWVSPPRAALMFSVLLRPATVPAAQRGWLPLLAGVAIAAALHAETGVDTRLKWPNDVLAGGAKLAGVLAEQSGDQIVVGAGINVTTSADELPPGPPGALPATSLRAAGATMTDREPLLAAILARLEASYTDWVQAAGDATACGLRADYQRWCATLGRPVRVALPGGLEMTGTATRIDPAGRLVVRTSEGEVAVSAGDVQHVR